MKLLSTVLMSVLALNIYSAETETAPELTRQNLETLDPAVRAEVQKALDEADRARVAYLQAIQRANESAIARIERQVQAQTRRGNLDGALQSRQVVEMLNNGWLKNEVEAETDMLGNRIITMRIEVISATYGVTDGVSIDVKNVVENLLSEDKRTLNFRVDNQNFNDISRGSRKKLTMRLRIGNEIRDVEYYDFDTVTISIPRN